MTLSIRGKLIAIASITALAFALLTLFGALVTSRNERLLTEIRERHLPKMEVGPRLEAHFEALRRGVQDAAAAQDVDALDATREHKDRLLAEISAARETLTESEVAALRGAIEEYYALASGVARRMIDGETGEGMVDAMTHMQAQHNRAQAALEKATRFDQADLQRAFARVSEAERTGARVRVWVLAGCMLGVLLLVLWVSRGLLRSLARLAAGFERFGRGEFAIAIPIVASDELDHLAERANEMAGKLRVLAEDRERADWMKAGVAGLLHELRGELEPSELATRVSAFIARYIEAPAAAFYLRTPADTLELLGHYANAPGEHGAAQRFALGEGLVGQAALQREPLVIDRLPDDYLRVRSGLGEARPRCVVLLPLVHHERVTGVLELALFSSWSPRYGELLAALSETLAIALEVSRARSAMRELLAETQRQAQRLATQEEELRATNEELQAQGEELQAQQGELKQSNEELIERSDELQIQQRALQQANTELQLAHERLSQKAEELSAVSSYKSQFLANMSHELRTPLNSMLLLSNLLAQNDAKNLSEKQVEFCKTINGAGNDLLALINQVLDLAKIESGKQELRVEPVEIGELAARAERIFTPLARDKGLELRIDVEHSAPVLVHSDRQRIEQILDNLIGNAIKFTQRGSVQLRIAAPDASAKLERPELSAGSCFALYVTDTGIGIAPEQQQRVFAPFEQVDARPDRRYGGTGLGLTIARELAVLLGGELQLSSAPGQGSTFSCYLPRTAPLATSSQPVTGVHPQLSKPHTDGRRASDDRDALAEQDAYLLVIEDDPVFAEAVGDVIHKQGLKFLVADSGARGLELARERRPSGIVLDVRLPDVDGFGVMEALRSDLATSAIPVHFVSALQAGERGMAMGAVGYLTKPASPRDLERAVESLARMRTSQHRILIVEDDTEVAESLARQLQGDQLEAVRASSAAEARALLARERFACMVLDLSLPDMDGLELLRILREEGVDAPPVIVHTGRALTKIEAQRLEAYAEAIVVKDGPAVERVLDEIRLFVRRLKEGLPAAARGTVQRNAAPLRLEQRKLLLVDDDMRTVYALSAVLRAKGAEVLVADTGRAALEALAQHPDVELVLMDIMMPEMDGYEAIRRLRLDPRFARLPVIALTAKAMKGDREKCLEVGATDYLAKPIDPESLAVILRERLPGARANGA
jgi:CheY-like chemotaxis protein